MISGPHLVQQKDVDTFRVLIFVFFRYPDTYCCIENGRSVRARWLDCRHCPIC